MERRTWSEQVARSILEGFETYVSRFRDLTRRAKLRFETMDWEGGRKDAVERLGIYEECLTEIGPVLRGRLEARVEKESDWAEAKRAYSKLIIERCDKDIAESFFNSVTRHVFNTRGINRRTEFFHQKISVRPEKFCSDFFTGYERQTDAVGVIRQIIEQHRFNVPYENAERDISRVANEVNLFLWPLTRKHAEYTVEILNSVFFRNKVAYVIGRILIDAKIIPIVLPLYNSREGVYIDAVLLNGADISNIFGFAYSYFHVETDAANDLVRFLLSILPCKPPSEIYNAIGFNRHGKTEFYRDLHRHVHVEQERFALAPGLEGAVMIVFTQRNYSYVLKVIKDRPCFLRSQQLPNKSISMAKVKEKYRFVCSRDRVGRLVDTQEFENIRFKLKRYSEEVLNEFSHAAQATVRVEDGYVIIDHCYIQRKVLPLPLFLETEASPEHIRTVLLDFGYFIKDLAGTGLFPADLFNKWNYGVTERSRVVLYDYDDIVPLEHVRFLEKPVPRDEYEVYLSDEDRISANENDFFMDEIEMWLGIPPALKGLFDSVHRDLYSKEFWEQTQQAVRRGDIADIIPYDRNMRFA